MLHKDFDQKNNLAKAHIKKIIVVNERLKYLCNEKQLNSYCITNQTLNLCFFFFLVAIIQFFPLSNFTEANKSLCVSKRFYLLVAVNIIFNF